MVRTAVKHSKYTAFEFYDVVTNAAKNAMNDCARGQKQPFPLTSSLLITLLEHNFFVRYTDSDPRYTHQ